MKAIEILERMKLLPVASHSLHGGENAMPCYFFSGKEYIKVLRGNEEAGSVLLGYPESISVWNWGDFGKNGIDAALYSGS